MIRAAALALLLLLAGGAAAQTAPLDSPEARAAAARRLTEIQWPQTTKSLEQMLDQLGATLPVEQRAEFKANLVSMLDFEDLRRLSEIAMVKTFTAGELTAMGDFYASPDGQSILAKMPTYLNDLLPLMKAMIVHGLRRLPREQRPPQYKDL